MEAFDITIVDGLDDADGWCFGYGPAISPQQWPRTDIGLPMCHRFTLRLPPDYRRHGDELVAIAVFNDDDGERLHAEPDLSSMPEVERHPHMYVMENTMQQFVVLWLTEAEFIGPRCAPPLPANGSDLREWMRVGSAAAAARMWTVSDVAWPETLDFARSLRLEPRADPNAGVQPPEGDAYERVTPDGYQLAIWFDDDDALHETDWSANMSDTHLGGTMQIQQDHPRPAFSPWFVGIGEALGGFNFGGGSGQLDLPSMRLDWASA